MVSKLISDEKQLINDYYTCDNSSANDCKRL